MKESPEENLAARKLLHTTVFAQCFSPCGKYVAACNNFGYIAVYSLVSSLAPDASDDSKRPIYTFKANEDGAIHCMLSTDSLLISAGNGDICAWKWSEILDKAAKVVWSLKVPQVKVFTNPEVNSLALNRQETGTELFAGCGDNNVYSWDIETGTELFAGCGDNNVYSWDIETGQHTNTFSGHKDYIHSICLKNNGREMVSAGEDGIVSIWDCNSPHEAVHIIEPYKHEMTCRPELGKWLGCVACDQTDDWMVCGGGPHLAAWHLRSLSPMATFDAPGVTHNFVMFHDDTVISGGNSPYVNHWFINGDQKSQVPCTPTNVFSVAINTNSEANKVLSVAGSSPKIDICTNFGYKAFSILFSC